MTRAVVTGGAGFIGSHITDLLIEQGMDVVVLDDLSTSDGSKVNPRAEFVQGSTTDRDLVEVTLAEADFVFHTAALPRIQPSFDDPVAHEEANVLGTIRCLEALKDSGRLKKFVISSSSACYGDVEELPTTELAPINCMSPYALQKYASEQYALILGDRFEIPVVSLRYFNVYGPRSFNPESRLSAYSSVIGVFNNQLKNHQMLTITGDGSQSRDFVHVRDVAKANVVAAMSDVAGEVFNVGFGKAYTILETAKFFSDDYTFISERKGEALATLADISKIKRELGWAPQITLADGIKELKESQ